MKRLALILAVLMVIVGCSKDNEIAPATAYDVKISYKLNPNTTWSGDDVVSNPNDPAVRYVVQYKVSENDSMITDTITEYWEKDIFADYSWGTSKLTITSIDPTSDTLYLKLLYADTIYAEGPFYLGVQGYTLEIERPLLP